MTAAEITSIVTGITTIGATSFIVSWMWKIFNKRIEHLEKQVLYLEKKSDKSSKYNHAITKIILDNKKCSSAENGECRIYTEFIKMTENEGIV